MITKDLFYNIFFTRFCRNVNKMLMHDKLKQFLRKSNFKWQRQVHQGRGVAGTPLPVLGLIECVYFSELIS